MRICNLTDSLTWVLVLVVILAPCVEPQGVTIDFCPPLTCGPDTPFSCYFFCAEHKGGGSQAVSRVAEMKVALGLSGCPNVSAVASSGVLAFAKARCDQVQRGCCAHDQVCIDECTRAEYSSPQSLGVHSLSKSATAMKDGCSSAGASGQVTAQLTANDLVIDLDASMGASVKYQVLELKCGPCGLLPLLSSHSGEAQGFGLAMNTTLVEFSAPCSPVLTTDTFLQNAIALPPGGGPNRRVKGALVMLRSVRVAAFWATTSGQSYSSFHGIFAEFDGGHVVVLGEFEAAPPMSSQPYLLTSLIDAPPGTLSAEIVSEIDIFVEFDGDINADGHVCSDDYDLMLGAQGAYLGQSEYLPRADFILDGKIDAGDLTSFLEVYQPQVCLPLRVQQVGFGGLNPAPPLSK